MPEDYFMILGKYNHDKGLLTDQSIYHVSNICECVFSKAVTILPEVEGEEAELVDNWGAIQLNYPEYLYC